MIAAILLVLAASIYFGINYLIDSKRASERVTQTISEQLATSSLNEQMSLAPIAYIPTATTTTPVAWKIRTYMADGTLLGASSNETAAYRIAYPGNMSARQNGSDLVLSFPKDVYFHWPLQDEARITISASTTCSRLAVPTNPRLATTSFSLNGYAFEAFQGDEGAAGNTYSELLYTTQGSDICYSFSLFDHGSSGADLYVDDPALIRRYDDQHSTDLAAVRAIFNQIVASFRMQ